MKYIPFVILILMAFRADNPKKDGECKGISRSIYTDEPYYGHTRLTIEKGRIIKVDFCVRDSDKHVNFDGAYEKYFAGNDLYVQQCRNDWKGIQAYPDSLIKHQDISKVDAISGATWAHNIFSASVKEALKK
ncbi:MAG: FMN-binding protein [Bacteroidales bacterium]|nr:FMN-binding protein [Bacteroidales bacterium]